MRERQREKESAKGLALPDKWPVTILVNQGTKGRERERESIVSRSDSRFARRSRAQEKREDPREMGDPIIAATNIKKEGGYYIVV